MTIRDILMYINRPTECMVMGNGRNEQLIVVGG